jgi:predicted N-formylglutamate amidohydrolase
MPLLDPDEPGPVTELRPQGSSQFVIIVDHASARIPRHLKDLGVPHSELQRHIAWDIGALAVAQRVAEALNAPLIAQNYSRLVIDCNRDPNVGSSIPTVSEHTGIPGNIGLTEAERAERRAAIFDPYHDRIRTLLDARAAAGRPTILVAQHSMTPQLKGSRREMHAAVLYNRDRRFAGLVLDALRSEAGLVVAENEPYFLSDATDYSIPCHGEKRGLPHVEIEIRQDLLLHEQGQRDWAIRITHALKAAERAWGNSSKSAP